MSDVTKKYVEYAGLQKYDELIKGQILSDAANAASTAVNALDVSEFALTTVSGSIMSISGIKEVDGKIAKGDTSVSLAKVAMTGTAEDVDIVDAGGLITATDVEGALQELAQASAGGVASKTIYLDDTSAGQSDYAKQYKLYQGANSSDMSQNVHVGTINIPKDKVLQDASIVNIVFKASDNTLHEGSESGTDVTALIMGSATPTAADAGKYLKMEMQNVDDPLYVNLQVFVDVYTVESGATEIQLALDDHEFSASVVTIDGTKIIYKAETSAGAGDGETVKAALTRLDGNASTDGSVSKKIADAIATLDTSSDVAIATHDSSTGSVTFVGGISEADGIVAAGSGDNVIFTPVSQSEVEALFA